MGKNEKKRKIEKEEKINCKISFLYGDRVSCDSLCCAFCPLENPSSCDLHCGQPANEYKFCIFLKSKTELVGEILFEGFKRKD